MSQGKRTPGDGGEAEIDLSSLPVGTQEELRDLKEVPEGFYAVLPPDLECDEVREYLPWWVEACSGGHNKGASGRGTSCSLHLPAEGSTREEVEKLCCTPLSVPLTAKDIPVHPKGFTNKCSKCLAKLRERASE